MKTLKHFTVMLLSVLLYASSAKAQPVPDKQQETQATNTIAQDVLIIIQQEKVRFTAQKAVAEMRLQIFDQAGELVYDSGAVTEAELAWALRQNNGEMVKSGLYGYMLSLKEAGAAEARVRRGHFIVDRARERDGQTDRLWITSQNESGVGTELTVARNEDVTIAGASATSERQSVKAGEKARIEESESKTESEKTTSNTASAIAGGTVNRIAKLISSTEVGDSIITEQNGDVGIAGPMTSVRDVANTIMVQTTGGTNAYAQFKATTRSQQWSWGTSQNYNGNQFYLADNNYQQPRMTVQPNGGAITFPLGNVGIGIPDPQAKLDVAGQTRTQSLQITGGADFAENFDVNAATAGSEAMTPKVEAGMVVSIDPASPGKLALSTRGYDRRVAGVVSGAGGIKPGMMMSQEGTLADGQHPVALSGRVYCWADASRGAIEPGDLLATSNTPGHAMKATDMAKAQGAIIGKAMTGLKSGKGLILVLINLQ